MYLVSCQRQHALELCAERWTVPCMQLQAEIAAAMAEKSLQVIRTYVRRCGEWIHEHLYFRVVIPCEDLA